MSEAVVAKRYADALFQLALEQNKTDQLVSQLSVVKEVFQSDDKIIQFLNHPRIELKKKIQIIEDSFKDSDKDLVNTLKILVERHRISNVVAIIDHFIHLYNEKNGIAVATVQSVRELSNDEKVQLETSLKSQLNKKSVKIENIIDPSLIGGVRIRVGNTIYDGSISNKLSRIRTNIVSAN